MALLTTKLYIPSGRTGVSSRPHLIEKTNLALLHLFLLISAPAGYGQFSDALTICSNTLTNPTLVTYYLLFTAAMWITILAVLRLETLRQPVRGAPLVGIPNQK